jgi:hypothetical protein
MVIAHGTSTVTLKDNLITATIEGSFNLEGIISYHNKIKPIIDDLQGREFKLLVNFLGAEGATPEALDEANRFNAWLNNKNLVAKALIINSPVLLEIFLSRVPNQNSQNIMSFRTSDEAHVWLKSIA